MGNLLTILFNPGNFIINNNDLSESESYSDETMLIQGENIANMVIQGENIENMLIPNEIQILDHNYTVLNSILDIEQRAVLEIAAAIQRELQIYHFMIYLTDNTRAQHNVYREFEDDVNSNDIHQYIHQNYN